MIAIRLSSGVYSEQNGFDLLIGAIIATFSTILQRKVVRLRVTSRHCHRWASSVGRKRASVERKTTEQHALMQPQRSGSAT